MKLGAGSLVLLIPSIFVYLLCLLFHRNLRAWQAVFATKYLSFWQVGHGKPPTSPSQLPTSSCNGFKMRCDCVTCSQSLNPSRDVLHTVWGTSRQSARAPNQSGRQQTAFNNQAHLSNSPSDHVYTALFENLTDLEIYRYHQHIARRRNPSLPSSEAEVVNNASTSSMSGNADDERLRAIVYGSFKHAMENMLASRRITVLRGLIRRMRSWMARKIAPDPTSRASSVSHDMIGIGSQHTIQAHGEENDRPPSYVSCIDENDQELRGTIPSTRDPKAPSLAKQDAYDGPVAWRDGWHDRSDATAQRYLREVIQIELNTIRDDATANRPQRERYRATRPSASNLRHPGTRHEINSYIQQLEVSAAEMDDSNYDYDNTPLEAGPSWNPEARPEAAGTSSQVPYHQAGSGPAADFYSSNQSAMREDWTIFPITPDIGYFDPAEEQDLPDWAISNAMPNNAGFVSYAEQGESSAMGAANFSRREAMRDMMVTYEDTESDGGLLCEGLNEETPSNDLRDGEHNCSDCNLSFKTKKSRNIHRRDVHGERWEAFQCACGHEDDERYNYERHRRKCRCTCQGKRKPCRRCRSMNRDEPNWSICKCGESFKDREEEHDEHVKQCQYGVKKAGRPPKK